MRRMRAFTLVELLVVITIIGILVSIAVPNYNKIRNKAKEQQVIAGGNAIVTALETFAQSHNGMYPGVALPVCDSSGPNGPGTDQVFFSSVGAIGSTGNAQTLYSMRGLIGGGPIFADRPQLPIDYLKNLPRPIRQIRQRRCAHPEPTGDLQHHRFNGIIREPRIQRFHLAFQRRVRIPHLIQPRLLHRAVDIQHESRSIGTRHIKLGMLRRNFLSRLNSKLQRHNFLSVG
ncbi:MAG TPA: type II secretion system protein [bacterium]|nr:type II secretion system protein [bacterium]